MGSVKYWSSNQYIIISCNLLPSTWSDGCSTGVDTELAHQLRKDCTELLHLAELSNIRNLNGLQFRRNLKKDWEATTAHNERANWILAKCCQNSNKAGIFISKLPVCVPVIGSQVVLVRWREIEWTFLETNKALSCLVTLNELKWKQIYDKNV